MDSLLGNTTNAWKFERRIHETATDSRAGEGAIQPAAEVLSASAAEDRSLGVRQVANPCSEEPYALMCARTDLWEPWAGNRPGRPSPKKSSRQGAK